MLARVLPGSIIILRAEKLSATRFFPGCAPPRRRCERCALRKLAPRRILKSSRRQTREFLSPINGIAKHFRDRLGSANKVHLKTVRLLFRTRLCIDAPDVRLGVGVGSF